MIDVVPRPLTSDERELVEWLVTHGTAEARAWKGSASDLRVIACCQCGCGSVDFAPEGSLFSPHEGAKVVADFLGASPEGVVVNTMLWMTAGEVTGLEVYSVAGEERFGIPKPSTLKVFDGRPD